MTDIPPPPPPPGDAPPPAPEPWDEASVNAPLVGPEGAGLVAAVDTDAVEAKEHREPEDRFRTRVAIAIAVVSILGAVVAFTGTLAGQSASQLDESGIEDTSTQQQVITNLSGTVEEDLRNLAPYQEDLKAAGILSSQAATLDNTDPSAAARLRAQAQSYKVLARTREQFFRGALPAPGASGAPVQYDAAATLHRLEAENEQLSQLRPDATLAQADAKHAQGVNLVGLVTLFIAALLFLTLAQFTRPAIRRLFALAGGVTALLAMVLWIVVLATGA